MSSSDPVNSSIKSTKPTTDTPKSVGRSALAFLFGTTISRFSGLLRDLSMAWAFGADPALGAFLVAFRFSNLMRRLLGEGAMHATFVPTYEKIKSESTSEASRFFLELLLSVAILLLGCVIIVTSGLSFFELEKDSIAYFSQWMWPGIIFICLAALQSSYLQCEKHFFIPSVAPVSFNIVWCAGVSLIYFFKIQEPFLALAGVIVVGYACHWLVTAPLAWKFLSQNLTNSDIKKIRPFSKHIKDMAKPLALGILGVGAAQINALLDAIFARQADPAGPAHLWYAIRLQQAPLALIGIAISGATLPTMARFIQQKSWNEAGDLLNFAFKQSLKYMFPATMILIALGYSFVHVLFGHGAFDAIAQNQTTLCLWAYSLGLIPQTFILLLSNVLYSVGLYKITSLAAVSSLIMNAALNYYFVYELGWSGASIAMATSISSLFNMVWLLIYIRKHFVKLKFQLVDISFYPILASTLFATFSIILVSAMYRVEPSWEILNNQYSENYLLHKHKIKVFLGLMCYFVGISAIGYWDEIKNSLFSKKIKT